MKKQLFREKSLKKLDSPEKLDEYIRVVRPGVWLLLACVIVLLIGACVWGFAGQVDSTVSAIVCIDDGKAFCYVAADDAPAVKAGQTVHFSSQEATIASIEPQGKVGYLCVITPTPSLSEGLYQGKIITQSYRPISFVLN